MHYKLLYSTAMLAGEIAASSGAETYRVEDTMTRILNVSKFSTVEVFATTTGIFATLGDPSIETITSVKRISRRVNHLNRIDMVNQISRDLCGGNLSVEEAYHKLITVKNDVGYSKGILSLAVIIGCAGFAGLLGGDLLDCFLAGINGVLFVLISRILDHKIASPFMADAVKGFAVAFFTMIYATFFTNIYTGIIIISSIMAMVPGVPITNAIRDTLQGDYQSGVARATEAFVISLGIAVGVGFGMGCYTLLERLFIL